jgi:hypothetical protein
MAGRWRDRRIGALMAANNRPDTAEEIRGRLLAREAAAAGVADREELFPVLTADNAAAAIAYQEERIRVHAARLAGVAAAVGGL